MSARPAVTGAAAARLLGLEAAVVAAAGPAVAALLPPARPAAPAEIWALLAVLEPGVSARQAARALYGTEGARETARGHIGWLARAGLAVRDGDGRASTFALTAAGRALLAQAGQAAAGIQAEAAARDQAERDRQHRAAERAAALEADRLAGLRDAQARRLEQVDHTDVGVDVHHRDNVDPGQPGDHHGGGAALELLPGPGPSRCRCGGELTAGQGRCGSCRCPAGSCGCRAGRAASLPLPRPRVAAVVAAAAVVLLAAAAVIWARAGGHPAATVPGPAQGKFPPWQYAATFAVLCLPAAGSYARWRHRDRR